MNIHNVTVMHCAQYASAYESNFIKSLIVLEDALFRYGCRMVYIFPKAVIKAPWWEGFSTAHNAYITSDDVQNSSIEIEKIIKKEKPAIIHTHFEGYDIPVVKATKKIDNQISVVWHMHDSLFYQKNPLKALYQVFCFYRHYNWYAKDVSIISVGYHLLDFANRYKRLSFSNYKHSQWIPNGVDENRVVPKHELNLHTPFTFFAFGSSNVAKRIDLLVRAAVIVRKEVDINILITEGVDTRKVVSEIFKDAIPEWCILVPQNNDLNQLFKNADCFVSSSVFEGFSYAICEAELYGFPVIQSDILGTKWNENNPSVLVFKNRSFVDLASKMKLMIQLCGDMNYDMMSRINYTRDIILHNYSLSSWAEKIICFYKKL